VQLATFQATGSDEKTYTVKVFQYQGEEGDTCHAGPPNPDPASWLYFASADGKVGHQANRLSKGRYQIPDGDIALASTDPNAP
jgi:hypothetical protein